MKAGRQYYYFFLSCVTVYIVLGAESAHAIVVGTGTSNNFSTIARNITASIEALPGLVSAVSYMIGILLGVLGILKLKDHVEAPESSPMKDGAIRLASGGALFALPIVFEAMEETIGVTSRNIDAPTLNRVEFNVR